MIPFFEHSVMLSTVCQNASFTVSSHKIESSKIFDFHNSPSTPFCGCVLGYWFNGAQTDITIKITFNNSFPMMRNRDRLSALLWGGSGRSLAGQSFEVAVGAHTHWMLRMQSDQGATPATSLYSLVSVGMESGWGQVVVAPALGTHRAPKAAVLVGMNCYHW